VTVAIKESLTQLNNSLQELEKTANQAQVNAEKAMEAATANVTSREQGNVAGKGKKSPDLFSVPSQGDVDAKALANRLDSAIERVEEMLKEGA